MTSSSIRRIAAGVAAALLLVTSASCDDGPTALKTGQLSLLLTDAPGDVSKAVVTIDQIYLQADSSDDNGRIVLKSVGAGGRERGKFYKISAVNVHKSPLGFNGGNGSSVLVRRVSSGGLITRSGTGVPPVR